MAIHTHTQKITARFTDCSFYSWLLGPFFSHSFTFPIFPLLALIFFGFSNITKFFSHKKNTKTHKKKRFRLQILLQDSINLRGSYGHLDQDIIRKCVNNIRYHANEYYRNSYIVFGAEAAPKMSPVQLQYALRGVDRLICMREVGTSSEPELGLPKTQNNTATMKHTMCMLLERGLVRFSKDYMTVESRPEDIKKMLREQLEEFQFVMKKNNETGSYSAKINGKNDDLVVSFLMEGYWPTNFLTSDRPDYADFKRRALATDNIG